jgi:cytochrome c oxidase cbb3-type subunit 3
MVVYPALPGFHSGSVGLRKWTSRGELANEVAAAEMARAPLIAALAKTPIEQLPTKPELMERAVAGGRAAFRVNCIQCHGSEAQGSRGYPNLADDDWLWGGDLKTIETTITHGVRFAGDAQTRQSLMPSFGRDGILTPEQVDDVADYVRSLSGAQTADAATRRGAAIFAANCAVCHGPEGRGGRKVGAPNLADQIWLYGGAKADVVASVTNAHSGVMPAWGQRLDPVTIKMLAAYVHSLGGGEKFDPALAMAKAPAAAAK